MSNTSNTCYEQDLEIIHQKLLEKLFFLQTQYFNHHIDDKERNNIKDKIEKLEKQLLYLKKILQLNVHYKGDLNENILSRL